MSKETLQLLLSLLGQVQVPVHLDTFETEAAKFAKAKREVAAALAEPAD